MSICLYKYTYIYLYVYIYICLDIHVDSCSYLTCNVDDIYVWLGSIAMFFPARRRMIWTTCSSQTIEIRFEWTWLSRLMIGKLILSKKNDWCIVPAQISFHSFTSQPIKCEWRVSAHHHEYMCKCILIWHVSLYL